MSQHPYKNLPDKAFWKRSVTSKEVHEVDPVSQFELRITTETKVATAGSCFAQHIARHLQNSGFNYYVEEKGHPIVSPSILKKHNYGMFSARYGNIYTARQLIQLFERAYGNFSPKEQAWIEEDCSVKDPFRPNVQPGGFISESEMLADRTQHLSAVRTMFETLDVFVFTLGLTECWISKEDGAAFPLCPGVSGGKYSEDKYEFYNQSVNDVISDMQLFINKLKEVNPQAQMILTVSPVPLMATAEHNAHVLTATTYSKSVLRVAAESLTKQNNHVHYFPSYEIITGAFNRGQYYSSDLRNVVESGVSHVMKLFLQHATNGVSIKNLTKKLIKKPEDDFLKQAESFVEVECDEAELDKS